MSNLAEYHQTIDELDRRMHRLCLSIDARNYDLLVLIREFDERGGWLKWGCQSCAQWLHWRHDVSLNTAHEKVRIARALKDLPRICDAFAAGEVSYSKVRALTRVATRDNEAALLDYARNSSAARLEERCRQLRLGGPKSLSEARSAHRARALRLSRADERGMVSVSGELPVELAQLLRQALDKAIEHDVPEGPEFEHSVWSTLQADALLALARHYLAGGASRAGSAGQYQVVVHVDEGALRGEGDSPGRADLPVESVRRLCCDGAVVPILSTADGEPLNVGRRQRSVPPAIRRALLARDGGCTWPGCTHRHFVDAHHIRHWAHGGETSLQNLTLLCFAHHRLVHEGGFSIRTDHRGALYFRRPDGRAVPRLGYRINDVTDECVHDESSAEDYPTRYVHPPHGVREPRSLFNPPMSGPPGP